MDSHVNLTTAKASETAFKEYLAEAEFDMAMILEKLVAPKELMLVPSNLSTVDKQKFKKTYEGNTEVVLFDGGSNADKMAFLYGLRMKSPATLFAEAGIDLGRNTCCSEEAYKERPRRVSLLQSLCGVHRRCVMISL